MKKNKVSEKKSKKKEQNSELKKTKGLFDHLNSIRITKRPDYYESLTEQERKAFNHWALLMWLSMDSNLIPLTALLWRDGYYDKIPSPQFYKLLVDVIPYSEQKLFWIKKSKKFNNKLLNYIASWYSISNREAEDYLNIFTSTDDGIMELIRILEGQGLSEKETEKILQGENEDV